MIHEIIQLIDNYRTAQWHALAKRKGQKEETGGGTLYLSYLRHKFAIRIGPVKVANYVSIKTTTTFPSRGIDQKTFTCCENCKLCCRTGSAKSIRTRTHRGGQNFYISCKFSLLSCNCFVVSSCCCAAQGVVFFVSPIIFNLPCIRFVNSSPLPLHTSHPPLSLSVLAWHSLYLAHSCALLCAPSDLRARNSSMAQSVANFLHTHTHVDTHTHTQGQRDTLTQKALHCILCLVSLAFFSHSRAN